MRHTQARFIVLTLTFFRSTATRKAFHRSSRVALFALLLTVGTHAVAQTECSDGVDNDNDGFVDLDDFDCEGPEDATEGAAAAVATAVSVPALSDLAVLLLLIAMLVLAGREFQSAR